jgi:preprotein translocase subunit SecD
MKTILYFIITSLICITLVSAAQKTTERTKIVILQASDSTITSQILTQSAHIISNRLRTYGLESSVIIIPNNGQIRVQLPDNINVSEIEGLLTTKGDLGFYETLTLNEIAGLLKTTNHQDLLKNDSKTSPSDARIGCSTFEDQKMVDTVKNYLKSINGLSDYKLLWGLQNSKSMTCLYALKPNDKGTSPLLRSDLETVKSSQDNNSQSITIEIKFKSESAKIWAITTKNSLGKPIAIVIDDKVFYTPVVRSIMENGLCEITGNFTQKEVNYFLALVNNDTLPVRLLLK